MQKFIYKGNDSLILAIILHICGQMELLKVQFINYGMKIKNEDFSMLASRHRYLIEHAELLVNVISFVLLVQMLFSCLIISLMGKYLLNLFPRFYDTSDVHITRIF